MRPAGKTDDDDDDDDKEEHVLKLGERLRRSPNRPSIQSDVSF